MLQLLKGKRVVYVGDSLNRNMWESLVCILHSLVENKSRVFEASGKVEFRQEGSYSFIFEVRYRVECTCSLIYLESCMVFHGEKHTLFFPFPGC